MARENQGLQIALIIFVMLTIILGVTTYLFFRQLRRGRQQGHTSQADANDQEPGMPPRTRRTPTS